MSDLFDEAANHGLIRVEEARRIHEFEMERGLALDRVLRIPPPPRPILYEGDEERLAAALHQAGYEHGLRLPDHIPDWPDLADAILAALAAKGVEG